ncbi:MAG: hypothetical protein H6Q62_377, partial [Firmicutes bacterium]|nr:hypothetical protein [Bacillota bacterium]
MAWQVISSMAQLNQMTILSIEDLEEALGVHKFKQYVDQCEANFERQLTDVVKTASEDLR